VLLLASVLVIGAALLLTILARVQLVPFETAIVAAFQGKAGYEIECSGFDCADIVPRLPGVSSVSCSQPLVGRNLRISALGACCSATFGDLGTSEIHVFRRGSGFEIILTEPRMRRVIRALDDERGQVSGSGLGT
jgi:hypothetical protein